MLGLNVFEDPIVLATVLPLGICSVLAFGFILERIVYLGTRKTLTSKEKTSVVELLSQSALDDAKQIIDNKLPFFTSAVSELMAHQNKRKEIRDEIVTLTVNDQLKVLRKRLTPLSTIAALAPMLGLLGTIVGLMRAFYDIGLSQGPVEPAVVADGLWQALSTTAIGMMIAVVCVLFNAYLRAKTAQMISDASDILSRFSLLLEDVQSPNVSTE
tara:strand:+ start:2040 stop:2681 length:642 start_codon:yes stop_codon:yes gene_type:complete